MPKSNVTVFLEVFNEEERIESCLKSFYWADELIVFDKNSTDRTREIAKKYATEIVLVPFSHASENVVKNISSRKSCEWILFPTASSLIHPNLVDEIIKLTSDNDFNYDVIGLPYSMYSFGISSKYSPWTALRKNILIRRSALQLSSKLHNEIGFNSDRIFEMPFIAEDQLLYHCTHKDADDFFGRVIRYTRYEAEYEKPINRSRALNKAFFEIFKSLATVVFRRRSFVLGWDGIALSLAYVCYFIMKFIYVWDVRRENGSVVYPALRKKIDALWDEDKLNGV
ncbi:MULTISPECIES: glycosyltransferase [Methylomonas]|uniref:Glycosyltransferase 2-like domain-containing protein n=2 Tax=Methylomonas TaxID=416 RepID=A0A140E3W0_9GAMM|nr:MULTISPECIES: glycosyltransferase [Methylomonas]AMK75084.1 hypothetical protein JT25_001065 [Methylomonas denitrificans]OAI02574.1 hypothetical protein A1342_02055 [Methylomonas methanica]TCV83102.1 glycosyltransferase involved in cell wall biosynthesis [Methylomonas methanica]